MSTDDYGKDLAGVIALQRKQDETERDMTAIHSQLVVSFISVLHLSYLNAGSLTGCQHLHVL